MARESDTLRNDYNPNYPIPEKYNLRTLNYITLKNKKNIPLRY